MLIYTFIITKLVVRLFTRLVKNTIGSEYIELKEANATVATTEIGAATEAPLHIVANKISRDLWQTL